MELEIKAVAGKQGVLVGAFQTFFFNRDGMAEAWSVEIDKGRAIQRQDRIWPSGSSFDSQESSGEVSRDSENHCDINDFEQTVVRGS